ncbi:chitobiase/beta-hexosaminidase C-terminal domain-containing protein [Luteolibacter arcticus]|uniref:Chitobiase/beta-hexosaminidase C-terminal domain-containing protein n=1 Tax=Luteolibacter arcticus TaxID=1581411 RepID=A0ABT3GQI9_9BACT|nr:chitobiase/beta-hexosaminidase C-terminal domain-containing protein [Luteolibacter arcticus]MCW1925789.1 chitobiase/beta-hexosaminidase C-terminal domain-containing protein [Luteolibacter arcticus]
MPPLRHYALTLLASLALAIWCRGDVVISEFQSSNGATLLDEDGDPSDWVELYNRGSSSVNLTGWGLSDRTDDPFKWVFPAVQIAAGQRLVIWCSAKDRTGAATVIADSPDDIPGLVLWLKAEGQSYTDGQSATTWTDTSGRTNHGTAPSSSNRPVFKTNRINGKPAFQFSRSQSQEFRLPTSGFKGMTSLNNYSLFAVSKWSGSGVPSGIFGAWNTSDPTTETHLEVGTLGAVSFRTAAMNQIEAEAASTNDEWAVLSATVAGTQDSPMARLYKNGQMVGSRGQGPGPVPLSSLSQMAVGSSYSTGRNFSGDIAELLLYDRPLNAPELAFLDVHLGSRYALPGGTLPTGPKIHTNFSIDSDGESLVLTRPTGTTEDLVPAAIMPQDASHGRSPESGNTWKWFASPTPGQPNAALSYGPPLVKPVLSAPRGFKTSTFSLGITHPESGVTLRYTLDGSEPSLTNGSTYSSPISINKTRVVRAAAFKSTALPSRAIATNSYIFLNDVVTQTSRPTGYPANWGEFTQTSYSISPNVAALSGYSTTMKAALAGLPSLSISLAPDDMFGEEGIYTDSTQHGLEEVVSAEWLTGDNSFDTQIDAGLRVHGGASRYHTKSPKKAFRLAFRGEYGEGRLRVPIFSNEGTPLADFNGLILRANFNNSWISLTSSERDRALAFQDQWMRDTQLAMHGMGSRGNLVHLYINGIYWGIYNPCERPDAEFSASYFGGDPEDYDAMNHDGVVDGDNIAWNTMRDLARAGITTPAQYTAIKQYLDVDQYIDYMLLNFYGSNQDWPDNNWTATRLRSEGAGYRFFVWDAEMTLHSPTSNRTNPPNSDLAENDNPGMLYTALRQNAEFRLRFADRARRYLYNGGALTPAALSARFTAAAAKAQPGIFAEQARWGAYRKEILDLDGPSPLYALNPHWLAARDWLLGTYFPARTTNLINQLKAVSLYPNVDAPTFSQHGGQLTAGQTVSITAPAGTIYCTLDGTDPRVENTGAVSPTAVAYTSALTISGQKTLKARALSGGVWSALNEAVFSTLSNESIFKPAGDATWTTNSNWTPSGYPNGSGKRAVINSPTATDRDVSLAAPITVGSIRFDATNSFFRNRIDDELTGKTLTFNGSGQESQIKVDGNGTGFVEFEVVAGSILSSTLELQVNQLDGDEEHGALRLRERWSGPGGLRKTGLGVASLTGEDKDFTGALSIVEGVLQVSEPSTPALASSITVTPGGQLRLTSGSTLGVPRVYGFTKPLKISGQGRGLAIPDDSGQGKQGALRYDPGNGENHAVLPVAVQLTAAAGIHVDGALNRLELTSPLTPAAHALTKSGGGLLHLKTANAAFTGPVTVATGTLELTGSLGSPVTLGATGVLTGHGTTGAISGDGTIDLGSKILKAPLLSGTIVSAVLANPGSPAYTQPTAAGNGLLSIDGITAPPDFCRIYLPNAGSTFRGVIFAPWDIDLAGAINAAVCEVYRPDGTGWSLATNAQVVTVPEIANFGSGAVNGHIVEVRLGAAPASFTTWQELNFPIAAERNNPAIGGPEATPRKDGIANLLRYALGIGLAESPRAKLPRLENFSNRREFSFPFDPGRDDIACLVEVTNSLGSWQNASVIFDSRTDYPGDMENGWLTVTDTGYATRRFYRLRVIIR